MHDSRSLSTWSYIVSLFGLDVRPLSIVSVLVRLAFLRRRPLGRRLLLLLDWSCFLLAFGWARAFPHLRSGFICGDTELLLEAVVLDFSDLAKLERGAVIVYIRMTCAAPLVTMPHSPATFSQLTYSDQRSRFVWVRRISPCRRSSSQCS